MLRVSKSILPKKPREAQRFGFEQYAFKLRSVALNALRVETQLYFREGVSLVLKRWSESPDSALATEALVNSLTSHLNRLPARLGRHLREVLDKRG